MIGTEPPTQLDPRRLSPPAATDPATLVAPIPKVVATSCFMARRQNSTFHNFRALKLLEELSLTFDHKAVELTQPELEANASKSLGGVRVNTTAVSQLRDQSPPRVHPSRVHPPGVHPRSLSPLLRLLPVNQMGQPSESFLVT